MSNVDIIRGAYDAFGRGDIEAVLAVLDESIEWYAPDELPDGGTYRGPRGVAQFFGSLPAHYEELRVEPDRFLDAGDQVIVEGHHRGTINGAAFEVGFAHVWTAQNGKATRFREYNDSGKLLPLFASASASA
jgi:ketosteroid isomerase-like protein